MADFLLVHDVAQHSWCWGRVWGHLTAPMENPPRLHARGRVGKVIAFDLPWPGSVSALGRSGPSLDDWVQAVIGEVGSQGLHNLVLVGHGVAASVLLRAASALPEPPKRIVVFAGIIPDDGKCTLDMLPRANRMGFKVIAGMNRITRTELVLPRAVITNLYCNGMDPFDMIQTVGRFGPLPLRLLRTSVRLGELARSLPLTYVPLSRDRLVPPALQRRMTQRLDGIEVAAEVDSCHEVMIERPREVADILLKYA